MSDDTFKKIIPKIDTVNSNTAVVKNGIVTVKPGFGEYSPVFAQKPVKVGEKFEVEIADYVGRFMIGVATTDLRNRANQHYNNNSMCIFADERTLYFDGEQQ